MARDDLRSPIEPFEHAISEWISRWKLDARRRSRLAAFMRRGEPQRRDAPDED